MPEIGEVLNFPDDVLIAVLNFFPEGKKFRTSISSFSRSLCQLSQQYPFLNVFTFDVRTKTVYSSLLEQALDNLEMSGLLSKQNPYFEFYQTSPSLKEYFAKFIRPYLKPEDLKQLEAVGKKLDEELTPSSVNG